MGHFTAGPLSLSAIALSACMLGAPPAAAAATNWGDPSLDLGTLAPGEVQAATMQDILKVRDPGVWRGAGETFFSFLSHEACMGLPGAVALEAPHPSQLLFLDRRCLRDNDRLSAASSRKAKSLVNWFEALPAGVIMADGECRAQLMPVCGLSQAFAETYPTCCGPWLAPGEQRAREGQQRAEDALAVARAALAAIKKDLAVALSKVATTEASLSTTRGHLAACQARFAVVNNRRSTSDRDLATTEDAPSTTRGHSAGNLSQLEGCTKDLKAATHWTSGWGWKAATLLFALLATMSRSRRWNPEGQQKVGFQGPAGAANDVEMLGECVERAAHGFSGEHSSPQRGQAYRKLTAAGVPAIAPGPIPTTVHARDQQAAPGAPDPAMHTAQAVLFAAPTPAVVLPDPQFGAHNSLHST